MKKAMASNKVYSKYKKDAKEKDKEMHNLRKEVSDSKQMIAMLQH